MAFKSESVNSLVRFAVNRRLQRNQISLTVEKTPAPRWSLNIPKKFALTVVWKTCTKKDFFLTLEGTVTRTRFFAIQERHFRGYISRLEECIIFGSFGEVSRLRKANKILMKCYAASNSLL